MKKREEIWPIRSLLWVLLLLEALVCLIYYTLFNSSIDFLAFLKWEFEQYKSLFVLSPLISIGFLWLWHWKTKAILNWKETSDLKRTLKNDISFKDLSFRNSVARFTALKLALLLLITAILGPKSGGEMTETVSEGVEVMIALDLSKSMLAEDVQPNRLYAAKAAIKNILKKMDGDKVGLVVFSANAYTQMPLSNDYASAINFLESLNTSTVPIQGTSISEAIKVSMEGFGQNSSASKILLLFTDGEDHEEELEETLKIAKERQIKISCLAIGSGNGAPIPNSNSEDKYKKDKQGNTVISKANIPLLQSIAESNDGFFNQIKSSSPKEVKDLNGYLRTQEKTETGTFMFNNLTPRFQVPLLLSVLFFIISMLIKEKEGPWF
jgi:Ca-activated chloride channel family protein